MPVGIPGSHLHCVGFIIKNPPPVLLFKGIKSVIVRMLFNRGGPYVEGNTAL
jgi:hypothetical protein